MSKYFYKSPLYREKSDRDILIEQMNERCEKLCSERISAKKAICEDNMQQLIVQSEKEIIVENTSHPISGWDEELTSRVEDLSNNKFDFKAPQQVEVPVVPIKNSDSPVLGEWFDRIYNTMFLSYQKMLESTDIITLGNFIKHKYPVNTVTPESVARAIDVTLKNPDLLTKILNKWHDRVVLGSLADSWRNVEFLVTTWSQFFPELFLITSLTFLIAFLVTIDYVNKYKYFLTNLSGRILIVVLLLTILLIINSPVEIILLPGQLAIHQNSYINFIKIVTLSLIIICILISSSYIKNENISKYEYYLILGLSAIGMMCIVSSNDLISMYMAIEIQSLSFYILATIKVYNNFSTEAGLKYFILGAFSSGILLFGCSFVYGSLGTINFNEMGLLLANGDIVSQHSFILGAILILSSILFKLGAAPFHMWLPDVYEGVPTPVTAIYSIVPKVALFTLMIKLTIQAKIFDNQTIQEIIIYVSLLSIIVGTLGGLYQTKIKRLLAYSAINHVGFLLIGLIGVTYFGFFALSFYIMIYILISINIFTILLVLRRKYNNLKIKKINEFAILFKSHPLLAINFCLILFSVAGIPPLAGFYSKFYIFSSAINSQIYLVAVVSALLSVLASMYYIRLIKLMFFKQIEYWDFFSDLTKVESYVISITFFFNLLFVFYPEFFILSIYNIITKN